MLPSWRSTVLLRLLADLSTLHLQMTHIDMEKYDNAEEKRQVGGSSSRFDIRAGRFHELPGFT